jgi:dTDP-4-dehydrorhamnose reductase
MRIVLFGGTGQIGQELQRTLLPHGRLFVPTRGQVNLENRGAVTEYLNFQRPDIIVNAAAYTKVDQAESEEARARALNALAVAEMADYAAGNHRLLIHYSTDYVFDGTKQDAYQPEDPPNPQSVYGQTKLEGEEAILASGCDRLVFRTSWVYSTTGHNFIKTMLRLAGEHEALKVVADQVGAPTSAEMIADVTSLALAGHHQGYLTGGTYHLTAAGATSWHGLACRVIGRAIDNGRNLKLQGEDIEAVKTPEFPTSARRPLNSQLDCSQLASTLRLELPDWTVHVNRTIDQITRMDPS